MGQSGGGGGVRLGGVAAFLEPRGGGVDGGRGNLNTAAATSSGISAAWALCGWGRPCGFALGAPSCSASVAVGL